MTARLSTLSPKKAENQRARSATYQRLYYEKNALRLKATSSASRKQKRRAMPDVAKAKDRSRYVRTLETRLLYAARVRAKRNGLEFSITYEDLLNAIPVDRCCPIIQQPFEIGVGKASPQSMTIDRVNPRLGYVRGNIRVISFLANTMKNNCSDPQLFSRWADLLRNYVCP